MLPDFFVCFVSVLFLWMIRSQQCTGKGLPDLRVSPHLYVFHRLHSLGEIPASWGQHVSGCNGVNFLHRSWYGALNLWAKQRWWHSNVLAIAEQCLPSVEAFSVPHLASQWIDLGCTRGWEGAQLGRWPKLTEGMSCGIMLSNDNGEEGTYGD